MPFARIIAFFSLTILLAASPVFSAVSPSPQTIPGGAIDALMNDAIGRGLIAGGVVLVGDSHRDIFFKSYGRTSASPAAPEMTPDAIFDLASLTKVVATAPSVMKLAETGRLKLTEPVITWFPELGGGDKNDLLLLHLLTHTSCLGDIQCSSTNPLDNLLDSLSIRKLEGDLGNRFQYADVNFILLGELVGRSSGTSLDIFSQESFYKPLNMKDTSFHLRPDQLLRCVPTLVGNGKEIAGNVQDQNARALGGVAGHAGVFSTASDLGIFCRMILGKGIFNNVRVFDERTISQMTAPYFARGGKVARGLGWDISSPYSSPRGDGFSKSSFGHTGYSGTSLWIDPEQDIFVVLLTARIDYKETSSINRLRRGISTIALRQFSPKMDQILLRELEEL